MFPIPKTHIIFNILDKLQNSTIEERVSLLELQVVDLDQDVNFLFDEQVIQDERLLNLEETSDQVVVELAEINADLQGRITNKNYIYDNIILFFQ